MKGQGKIKCCICHMVIEPMRDALTGDVIWASGHNAQPVHDGRCCDGCNDHVVLHARLKLLVHQRRAEEA